jgi:hypothetical protein
MHINNNNTTEKRRKPMRGRGCLKATLAGIMVPLVLIILLGSWVVAGLVAALGMATGDFCQVSYTT